MDNDRRPSVCKVGARKELYDICQGLIEVWKEKDLGLLMENKTEIELLRKMSKHLQSYGFNG